MNIGADMNVREIQERLNRAGAIAAGNIDQPSPDEEPSKWAVYADSVFRERLKLIKGSRKQASAELSDIGGEALELRKAAVTRFALDHAERLGGKYPEINIAGELIRLNAPCGAESFSELNRTRHIELAAAICILDALKQSGKLDDALPYLPENRDQLDRVDMPDIADSVHPDDLIRGMLYAVHYRKSDEPGDSMLLSAGAAEDSDDRRNFDAIINLLGEDITDDARRQIIDAVEKLAERRLSELAIHRRELKVLAEKEIKACDTYLELCGGSVINPLQSPVDPEDAANILREALEAEAEARKSGEALDEKLYELESCYLSLQSAPVEDISCISDPYTACLGFISLLDSGSDCIHIYNIPYQVMARVCFELPWSIDGSGDPERDDMNIAPEFIEAAKKNPEKYIRPYSESILNRRIVKQPFTDSTEDRISFARLVYLTSGMMPPRGLPELSYIKALLEDSGLSGSEIDILYEYLTLAYYVARRDEDYIFIDEEEEDAAPAPSEQESPDLEQVREQKREIKALKALINKLEHRVRKSGEALQIADENLNRANAELAELRSMIRKADKTDADYTVTVEFPYTVKKRTVVFGGHESWSKAIRPLLNDVRFVETSAQPNPVMIRNAEVVWIQTNAMSHANFYKIIDIVRKHDIELRYFKYASAEKCAEQLALEDALLSGDAAEHAEQA